VFNMIYMSYQQLIYYFISKYNSSEGHSCLLQTPPELANKHPFRFYLITNCHGKQPEDTKLFLPQTKDTWEERKASKYCQIKELEENSSLKAVELKQEQFFCLRYAEMGTGVPNWIMQLLSSTICF